ncbi:MAG TPA: hypothetical protein VN419_05525 [Humidesulfovibrio sp.]|uniref:hypothetical protein n=1 Tax=Humidesulfovibrio sp. TaxID=2910988 RepID=UPI002C81D250|nr:hypothetical protein [Humidesulfovibrio sp.]HWR03460.1 hypothetical protein [Humidesulfovibrio sp.]
MNLTLILLIFLCSLVIGFFGRKKKLGFWGFFFASLMLTPVFGLLLLVIAGPGAAYEAQRR